MSVNKKNTESKRGRKPIESPLEGEIGELYLRGLVPGGFCCVDIARGKGIFTAKTLLGKKDGRVTKKKGRHVIKDLEIPDGSRYTRLLNNERFEKYFKKEDRVVEGKRRTYYVTERTVIGLKPIVDYIEETLRGKDISLKMKKEEKANLLTFLSVFSNDIMDIDEGGLKDYDTPKEYIRFGIGLNLASLYFGLSKFDYREKDPTMVLGNTLWYRLTYLLPEGVRYQLQKIGEENKRIGEEFEESLDL